MSSWSSTAATTASASTAAAGWLVVVLMMLEFWTSLPLGRGINGDKLEQVDLALQWCYGHDTLVIDCNVTGPLDRALFKFNFANEIATGGKRHNATCLWANSQEIATIVNSKASRLDKLAGSRALAS